MSASPTGSSALRDSQVALVAALCLVIATCALAIVHFSGGDDSEAGDDDIFKAGKTYELWWGGGPWSWLVTIPDGVEGSAHYYSSTAVCEPVGNDGTVDESACRGSGEDRLTIRLWAEGWSAQTEMGVRTGVRAPLPDVRLDNPGTSDASALRREAYAKFDELFASLRKWPDPPWD